MKRRITIIVAMFLLFSNCKESKKNSVNIDLDSALSDLSIENVVTINYIPPNHIIASNFNTSDFIKDVDLVAFPTGNEESWDFSQAILIKYHNEPLNATIARTYPNGKLKFEAECVDGWIEGTTKTYDSLGNLTHRFNYKEGKLNGVCEIYHPNNKLARSIPMSNGKVNGTEKAYYENGNLSFEGEMSNGEKSGTHIYFFISGRKSHILPFSFGIRPHSFFKDSTEMGYRANGDFFEYFENGDIKYKAKYVNGQPEGQVVAYYEKDKLEYIENWQNGHIVGEAKSFYENGQLQYVGKFNQHGEEIGEWREYFQSGNLRLRINFDKGKIIEQHYFNCNDTENVEDLRTRFPGAESRY
jgi:antitoxin component YwqK of YwqJK toxin-antitoxin module